ncbi:serine/threonine-protein kinase [Salix suchowensis]|nr:serine/threonine-protein kinase [Salix suchowensis]
MKFLPSKPLIQEDVVGGLTTARAAAAAAAAAVWIRAEEEVFGPQRLLGAWYSQCRSVPAANHARPIEMAGLEREVLKQKVLRIMYMNLAFTIDQAKMNGWHTESRETEFQEKTGQGSTADFYRAIWRGFDVAVKCIFPNFFLSNESGVSFLAQKLDTLSRQRHPYEWLQGAGSRRNERSVPIPPFHNRVTMALEIAQAMRYLHEQKPKVIHHGSNHVRVVDSGHARFLDDSEMAHSPVKQARSRTYVYMAPEVIRCEPYNGKSDVYSFAAILDELMTGNYPYIETDFGSQQGKLRPMLPHEDNDQLGEFINLVSQSWDQDASAGPSFARIASGLRKIQQRIIGCLRMSDLIIF